MIKVLKDKQIAVVASKKPIIVDVNSALDLLASVSYETKCQKMIVNKEAFSEEFFDLKTKLLGETLQKFVNYKTKIAVVGDFSIYSSTSLKDFIYESNKGKDFFFVATEKEAVEKLK